MDGERSHFRRGPSFRFTIRGLLLLTTLIAAFFGGRRARTKPDTGGTGVG
jgi:hypothetical protein